MTFTSLAGARSRLKCIDRLVAELRSLVGSKDMRFIRTLAMSKTANPWLLTSLHKKLIKIGAKVESHGRDVTFQTVEVAVSRQMFEDVLSLIARLWPPPASALGSAGRVRLATKGEACLGSGKNWPTSSPPRC